MLWLALASGTALCEALKDATGKQALKSLDEYSVLLGFTSAGALLMAMLMLATEGPPTLGPDFGLAILVGGSLNILAFTLYTRAIKIADLSLTVPLVTLTPLFLLVTSPIIVGEWPTGLDVMGVLFLIVGSYILNLKPSEGLTLAPLRALMTNPGSRMMMGVAFLWSITSNFDKVGTLNSSSLFWGMSLFGTIAMGMMPFVVQRAWQKGAGLVIGELRSQALFVVLAGVFNAIGVSLQFIALTLAPVAQVIAVKRMSALISVGFGYALFGETGLKERLLGAAIMVSGVAIMAMD
ncbi:DMT family transporter [Leptothoe sp. LEGE 181152]|uniref:EamA family transporter n=1 Tax=Adonisia turfae CCMR0081 TaxID=2292702 RepID=A0A6M0RWI4_9CYAN|nr:DMT family transporter [Adonisia turfae]MDV3351350.1 DMT family transporter [Leptothoe sp. LEGE 181152]NEZ60193.1 EamA family transporter [Adonisia turfae CCMR0081]